MDTQSSHAAQRVTADVAGHESNSSPLAAPRRGPFSWTQRDTDFAFAILLALDLSGRFDLGRLVRESHVELQYATRPPSIDDAWRFFEAGRLFNGGLVEDFGEMLGERARTIARRCALAAAGFDVLDVQRARFGTAEGFVVRTRHSVLLYENGAWSRFATTIDPGLRALVDSDATGAK